MSKAKSAKPRARKAKPSVDAEAASKPFWETKTMEEMTHEEWESLCDGCAKCCLIKLEDEDTEQIYATKLACHFLNIGSCRCRDYPNRHASVPDCVVITPENVRTFRWLPSTCGYRKVAEGQPLDWWHPLVSGDPDTVHQAGISIRSFARSERGIRETAIARYIIGEVD